MTPKEKIEARITELNAINYYVSHITDMLNCYDENYEFDKAYINVAKDIIAFLEKKANV